MRVVYIGVQVNETFGGGSSTPATPAAVRHDCRAASERMRCGRRRIAGKAAKPIGDDLGVAGSDAAHGSDAGERVAGVFGERAEYFFAELGPPPVVIPKPIAPARPKPVASGAAAAAPATGPPPPPPIDLKFFGTATSPNGKRQAFLLHGDDVFLASAGDIVLRRYRVISVDAKSILVEDMQNNNRQTLPLLAN